MREAYFYKSFIRSSANESLITGVSLGYDRCAEHEGGIRPLKAALHISDDPCLIGVEARLPTLSSDVLSKCLKLIEKKHTVKANPGSGKKTKIIKSLTLEFVDEFHWSYAASEYSPHIPTEIQISRFQKSVDFDLLDSIKPVERGMSDHLISSHWSSSQFRVSVFGEARCSELHKIYDAMMKGRVVVTLSGSRNPFAGAGFCLVNVDVMSADEKNKIREADVAYAKMMRLVAETGIHKKLSDAGKKFYALSPTLEENDKLSFWLNPTDQHIHRSGWFCLEDLEQWAMNTGPVLKSFRP